MINMVYAGNSKVFKGVLLSVMSALKNCKEPLHIYVLTMDATYQNPNFTPISEQQILLLDRIIKEVNPDSIAERRDVTDTYKAVMSNNSNKNSEYTPFALLRLMLDIYEDIPDKLIYIDVDTMVYNNIAELFNEDIEDYEFGVVLDYMGKFWVAYDYFNSGVMLINMVKARETELFKKARDLAMTKWLKMPDQSALYRMSKYRKYLDPKYNEQRGLKEDTVVKHFCRGIKWLPFFHLYNYKQWDIEKVHKKLKITEFDDIYDIYNDMIAKYPYILD